MNKILFSGRVGKDAEFKNVSNTAGCYQFSVANDEAGYYDKNNQWVKKTVWMSFQCDMINDVTSEHATRMASLYDKVKKGAYVEVEAHLGQIVKPGADGKNITYDNHIVENIRIINFAKPAQTAPATPQATAPQKPAKPQAKPAKPQAPQAPAENFGDADIPF